MSNRNKVMAQPVGYLGLAEGVVGSPPGEERVVIITIRPEPSSFCPHNIAIAKAQAERLWEDLGTVLYRSVVLLLCLLLATATGCSARVEVESSKWTTPPPASSESDATAGEKARTTVEVDLLQTRSSVPPPPRPTSSANTVILNLGDGDIHVHQPPARAEARDKATPLPRKSNLNTKIGWPSTYWQHGPSAFTGYLAAGLLVGTAMVLMIATVGRTKGGPMLSTIVLLVAAAVILQALPAAELGLQFLPLSPWAYSGFVSICLSILCWLGIFLAALIAMLRSGLIGAPSAFSAAVLFSMGMNLLLSLGGGSAPTEVASACFTTGPVSSRSQLATGEKGRTAIPVDLLQPRSQEPISSPKPPEPPKPAVSEAKPLNISGNTFVLSYRGGHVTYRSDIHVHIHDPSRRQVEERVTIHGEAQTEPRRPVDGRCERLAEEHLERVKRWKAFPN